MTTKIFALAGGLALLLAGCNQSSEKEKKGPDNPAVNDTTNNTGMAPSSFMKEVTYGNYHFVVTTTGTGNEHHFKLIPSGLSISNDTLQEDVKGEIRDVIISDIDGDNSPEIGVIDSYGADSLGHLHLFSTFNGKSIGFANYPDLPQGDTALIGYRGRDEFEFVENTLVRRFPVFDGEKATGKMRQLQYKLKPGEAMKQLVLDKVVVY